MALFGNKKDSKHAKSESRVVAEKPRDVKGSYGQRPRQEPTRYMEKEERRANRRWLRFTLGLLLVVALLGGGAFAAIYFMTEAPTIATDELNPNTGEGHGNIPPTANPLEQIDAPSVADGRREGTYTFAIVGTDVQSGSTDTILVGMLDTESGALNVVSIPRDTLVNTGYNIKKINYIYPAAVNNGHDGMEPLLDALEDMMGYRVDSYALVDVDTVASLVEAIGGVWFDVPVDMQYEDYVQDLYIDIEAGYQKLNGEQAVQVMRYRYSTNGTTYPGGDIDRIDVQQDLMMALAEQMLSLGNIPNIAQMLEVYEEEVETNVTTGNLLFYAQEFLKLDVSGIQFSTLPANYWGTVYGEGYCIPYVDNWLELVNTQLNPFTEEITRTHIDMLYSNGETLEGTQGYINGGIESFKGYDEDEKIWEEGY